MFLYTYETFRGIVATRILRKEKKHKRLYSYTNVRALEWSKDLQRLPRFISSPTPFVFSKLHLLSVPHYLSPILPSDAFNRCNVFRSFITVVRASSSPSQHFSARKEIKAATFLSSSRADWIKRTLNIKCGVQMIMSLYFRHNRG